MYVVKRNGQKQKVLFDKISSRIAKLCYGLDERFVEPLEVAKKVIVGVYNGVTTSELDELAAETAAALTGRHPHYALLASRLLVNNLHKNTSKHFSEVVKECYEYVNLKNGKQCPLLSKPFYEFVSKHAEELDSAIIYDRDYKYNYFGFKTLQKSYLLRVHEKIRERPQQMIMRVACQLHMNNENKTQAIERIMETYTLMSQGYFTHATPTLFNSGAVCNQLSSCFLQTIKDDSIEGIYESLKDDAIISKHAGAVGIAISHIRASGSYIAGTNGTSNGIIPMLRVFNNTGRYVDQGGGKRKGSLAPYLEPWHADIVPFLALRKNNGFEENRARDLFLALWVCDEFMRRVRDDAMWSLFCPNEAPGLWDCWGKEFEELYAKYENTPGLARKTMKARELWDLITTTQTESGQPFMLYKDACNSKSNQRHLGTIRCSNLCTEIIEYSSPTEIAVCNLASIAFNMFVTGPGDFNFQLLHDVVCVVTKNLNCVIDVNFYPVPEARNSNMKHRPIGIGAQGFADCLQMMRYPFKSEQARKLNIKIFETIYYAACKTSMELAKIHGPYESYQGSPLSQGLFQFDLWGVKPSSGLWDWETLRVDVGKYGMRNSLLTTVMPTASTSQILGNNEGLEPFTSNVYVRRTSAGECVIINKHLIKDLSERNLWNDQVKDELIANNGSVQNIECIPQDLKELYETVWEISSKVIIDMAADRGPYICQSQSMNIHMKDITPQKLTSMHFYAWEKHLKTGMYYLRSQSATDADKVTVEISTIQKVRQQQGEEEPKRKRELDNEEDKDPKRVCSLLNREKCESCSA